MVSKKLPKFVETYRRHPLVDLVEKTHHNDLAELDTEKINGIIQAEDLIYPTFRTLTFKSSNSIASDF